MGKGTNSAPMQPLSSIIPTIEERPGGQPITGLQRFVSVPLVGTTAASTNYITGAFIAPSDGWYVVDAFVAAQVAPDYASATLALENYDKSGVAGVNLLAATNFNLETLTAKQGTQLTLSTTLANRMLDEGDTIIATVAIGATEAVVGLGIFLTLVVMGPEVDPQ